jgi:hypothetical protein
MEPYFSVQRGRRSPWKGHATKANVRNVIRVARRTDRDLRVFATGADAEGWVTYTEIPAERWDEVFAESEAKP